MQLKSHLNAEKQEASVSQKHTPSPKFGNKKEASFISGDYFLIFIFFFVGSGLWAGKEMQSMQARQGEIQSAPITMGEQAPLFDLRNRMETDMTSEEALKWIRLLISIEDAELTRTEQFKKYQSLSMATAIMSASSEGIIRQRFWSGQSVAYSEESIYILAQSNEMYPSSEINKAQTQLLMSMALNYFQEGGVLAKEVADQFENISTVYLMENGFFENKILRALAREEIIELPGIHAGISI